MTIEPAKRFTKELKRIINNKDEDYQRHELAILLQLIIDKALSDEKIHFTSFFSKLAYLADRYELTPLQRYEIHFLRKKIQLGNNNTSTIALMFVIASLLKSIWKYEVPQSLQIELPKTSGITFLQQDQKDYFPHCRFVCTNIDSDSNIMKGYIDDETPIFAEVKYHVTDRNERFTENIESIQIDQIPILIELIEVEVRENNLFYPQAFVIEPDYMVDVTSIASSFNHKGTEVVGYAIKRFFPIQSSIPILVGNMINYCLDVLINNPEISFQQIVPKFFEQDPLIWCIMEDAEVKETISKIKGQFQTLKNVIHTEFKKIGIDREHCYLEPSFYSSQYGIQGRLDLLHIRDREYTIIELKSGSAYRPNVYGLNNSHYTQTLLYDLIIRSTFQKSRPKNYILYSKYAEKPLRIAPRIAAQQKEALKVRNELLQLEYSLQKKESVSDTLENLSPVQYPHLDGFTAKDLKIFSSFYEALDPIEKVYFERFVNFIANEHRLSKIGEYGLNKRNGLASLWLDSTEAKMERFDIIGHLQISDNRSNEIEPLITFEFTKDTNKLSNFRIGDIALLYPQENEKSCLKNQVFKTHIVGLDYNTVTLRLRSQQTNQSIFTEKVLWAIEHDMMDRSYYKMYDQIFGWAKGSKSFRELILTRRMPSNPLRKQPFQNTDELTDEQSQLIENMIAAKEYYLVWGPPGTGKTSKIIKHYVEHIFKNNSHNIYLLAYTNRAVDEICESIHSLGKEFQSQYIRVGSRYSTDDQFKSQLLQEKVKDMKSRQEILTMLKSHRIVVGTISSIVGKPILLDLIQPTEVIIDEASQILEPNIVGILSKFKKFILVGDHRQLPAVVVQSEDESEVHEDSLRSIGLKNCRNSLFERLYLQCEKNNWNHALGLLSQQGRMHEELMSFPNTHFYKEKLQLIPHIQRLTTSRANNELLDYRMVFVNCPTLQEERLRKTSSSEVRTIQQILDSLYLKYGSFKNIGIITPFRAQIAALKNELMKHWDIDDLKIDTVERYQGGAKDIIIFSFCANSLFQLEQMVSLSVEGIDRKLNVALTRAKEQLILTGDESILRLNPLYAQLLDYCKIGNYEI